MKEFVRKEVVLVVSVVFVIMLIAGCEEQNLSNTKKSRLIAAENIQLKTELEQRNKEIERQKELLEKCLQEKKVLEKRAQKDIEDWMDNILKDVAEENAKLREENKKLKAEIMQLEARIKQLETELEELKKPGGPKPLPAEPKPL